ncbi:membrane protein [Roseibium aquae]|uniref:Membrane protein n=1 Tax=Roseibium aquae TaxID=1323746 RepID=A0A916X1M6_9HYPH|nr:PepSY domain-containing protein [Roseibium aquae]GGB48259.1 membrane protein [Roseibium aquae]
MTQQVAGAPPKVTATDQFYRAAWRWHFYAGLFVAPFFILLAVTGMMMMFIGYFGGRDGEKITIPVAQNAQVLPVSVQADAAVGAVPGGAIVEWLKPRADDNVSVFRIRNGDTQTMVAVDPYTGAVVDTWIRRSGWYDFADGLHSDLLIGTTGDRLLEIAAGFGFILLVTGLYLWWPRDRGALSVLVPDLAASGRQFWKSLHMSVGVWLSVFLVLFLITGMAWTGVWGAKLVQAWSTFPAEKWDNVPLSDDTHASMNHGNLSDVPWALEQTPMPASGSSAGAAGTQPGVPVTIDAVADLAVRLGLDGRYRIAYPRGQTGVWTINQDTMSSDAENPFGDRTVHIDRFSGQILADVRFADYSLAGKSMAVGIPFHMGLMGLWNLVLNTIVCLGVIFLSVSGLVMWWLRRPKGGALRVFAPKTPEHLPHWRGAMIVMLLLSLAFPLVGITLLTVLTMDYLIVKRVPLLRKAFA